VYGGTLSWRHPNQLNLLFDQGGARTNCHKTLANLQGTLSWRHPNQLNLLFDQGGARTNFHKTLESGQKIKL